ncbi:unnamed protein product [Rhizophagus irregularis]|nr:unnamed protein product [Rhizophagus irregularis]
MFEQFKKISSASFKDFIDTTGLQVVRNEWENIRTKSAEILTPALNPRLGSLSPRLPVIGNLSKSRTIPSLDIPATTEFSLRYENDWNSIKAEDENNFRNAILVDGLIQQILKKCENHYQTCELVKSEASQLPKVKVMIDEITHSAISLKGKLSELENMIDDYAKNNQEQIFEDWKRTELRSLDKHIEEKEAELAEKRNMYQQHYEEFMRNHKIQKVQSYQADFETQMENYKKRMINPALHNEYSPKLSDEDLITSLEQVELETADDREALENFLRSNRLFKVTTYTFYNNTLHENFIIPIFASSVCGINISIFRSKHSNWFISSNKNDMKS